MRLLLPCSTCFLTQVVQNFNPKVICTAIRQVLLHKKLSGVAIILSYWIFIGLMLPCYKFYGYPMNIKMVIYDAAVSIFIGTYE